MRISSWVVVLGLAFGLPGQVSAQSSASSEMTEQERTVARQFTGFKYYLEKGEPARANRYIHAMYLYLRNVEFASSPQEADAVFQYATRMRNRREFFLSMGVSDADGNLHQSDGPCTYFWEQARDGTACGERAARPNQRVR